jgi:hypothetical protein
LATTSSPPISSRPNRTSHGSPPERSRRRDVEDGIRSRRGGERRLRRAYNGLGDEARQPIRATTAIGEPRRGR